MMEATEASGGEDDAWEARAAGVDVEVSRPGATWIAYTRAVDLEDTRWAGSG